MCKNCAFDFIVGADARVCPSKRPCLPASMPICLLRNEFFSRLLHHDLDFVELVHARQYPDKLPSLQGGVGGRLHFTTNFRPF